MYGMYIKYYINNKTLYKTKRKKEKDAFRAVRERESANLMCLLNFPVLLLCTKKKN